MIVWMWYCNLSLALVWDGEEKVVLALFTQLQSFKSEPPWAYLYRFTSAPPPCCHEARHHFKVISPMSNFTLGYAWVERIRAAIILNTCFRRYFFLSLCAFILRWWSANEQTGRCILTEVLWGFLEGLVSATLFCLNPSSWGKAVQCAQPDSLTNEPHHQVFQLI